MLSEATRNVIKSTVPVLEVHGEQITSRFYKRLFASHPELLNIFNQTNQRMGRQQTALANAVYAAALHIDNLEAILPAVKKIAYKHRGLGVLPEHYPIVGENLLQAIKDVLGDAATDEIINAWAEAYGLIADAFISVEHDMYKQTETMSGGWSGFRPFIVFKKEQESDVITSFYLRPQDGKAIAQYEPGQYITLKADIPGENYTHRRQYSLSDAPGKSYYRISVKREDSHGGNPAGVVSTYLHKQVNEGDVLYLSAPAGDFVLQAHDDAPIVFISGGVGLTPLVSMLNTLLERGATNRITYIHAAMGGNVHAFRTHMIDLAKAHDNLTHHVVYTRPSDADREHPHFSKEGYIDLEWLQTVAPQNAQFYFCGPVPFMKAVYQALRAWDVQPSQIHYEFFGPEGSLEA